jgi:signal-transduction protein with cAMP-binding, CBS, and nucleotidyltransferase domain
MYLIVHGTVAVYTRDGDELGHLVDGNIFGEIEFLQFLEMKVENLIQIDYYLITFL